MKKTYQITFKAELTEDDVRAMNKCFFDAMNEGMDIHNLWGLEMEEIESEGGGGSTPPSFEQVSAVTADWFGFMGDEDCENIAQAFATGISEGKDPMDILVDVCGTYNLDVDEFEGICPELEDLEGEEDEEEYDEYHGIGEEAYNELIGLFRTGLHGWTWEAWDGCGAIDKEDVANYAWERSTFVSDKQVIYEIFWDWANNLEEDDFPEEDLEDEDYDEDEYEEDDE